MESYTSNHSNVVLKEAKIEESLREEYDKSDDLITCFMLDSKAEPRSRVITQHKSTKREGRDLTREE